MSSLQLVCLNFWMELLKFQFVHLFIPLNYFFSTTLVNLSWKVIQYICHFLCVYVCLCGVKAEFLRGKERGTEGERGNSISFFLFFFKFIFDWRIIAYIHQHESAIAICMAPPSWTSLSLPMEFSFLMAVIIWLSYRNLRQFQKVNILPLNWHNHQGIRGISPAPWRLQCNSSSLPIDFSIPTLPYLLSQPQVISVTLDNACQFTPWWEHTSAQPELHGWLPAHHGALMASLARCGYALDHGQLPYPVSLMKGKTFVNS